MRKELGANVTKARKRKWLSQRDAAREIGISAVTLNRIERGRVNPSVAILLKIADGLGTSAANLLKGVKP